MNAKNICQVILKVTSRCNLNCSYCYIYNKGDTTWERRPALMSDEVFTAALDRISQQCARTGQQWFNVAFHGGEPCLLGPKTFDRWCTQLHHALDGITELHISFQTNGTLLNSEWATLFKKHEVAVGISMDGPEPIHDAVRTDHKGRGSYKDLERGLRVLRAAGVSYHILCVIPLGADPVGVHRHFVALGCNEITYLLPDFTHDTIAPVRKQFGETPCADFLMPIFDEWSLGGDVGVRVNDLYNVSRLILGGESQIETLGNRPPLYIFVEPDGEMEGLDALRVCRNGIARIHLNVLRDDLQSIWAAEGVPGQAIFGKIPTPGGCFGCPEQDTCSGGYLPHRFSSSRMFDNPSVWCADLLRLFTHARERLGVTAEETQVRRKMLSQRRSVSHG